MVTSTLSERHAHKLSAAAAFGQAPGTTGGLTEPDDRGGSGGLDLSPTILQSWQRCLAQPDLDPLRTREQLRQLR